MRLTLRTLLAYLDSTLDPEDAGELAKRIEESDFARDLVHRIRDCTKRLRLGAPRIDGRAAGLDPNTVADYLDNTLPAGRVPDFEKVCLESDVHLAEVAACHQILAMVLSTPAMLDPEGRQRMYELINAPDTPTPIDELPTDEPGVESLLGIAEPPAVPLAEASALGRPELEDDDSPRLRRKKPEVPDYLRESSRSRWWAVAATVAVAAGLTALVLWLKDPVLASLGLAPATVEENAAATVPTSAPADAPSETDDSRARDADSAASDKATAPPTSPEPDRSADPVATKQPAPPTAAADKNTGTPDETDANAADAAITEKKPAADVLPSPDATEPPADPADAPRKPAARPIAETIGRFVSEDQILLRHDRRADQWVRLATGANLNTGDRLVALPLFRPKIMLNTGLTAQLVGGTVLELHPAKSNTPAGITLVHGRLAQIAPVARQGVALHVRYGDRAGTITFSDTDAAAALECYRFYESGADPMTASGPTALDLIVTQGKITWQEGDAGQPEPISAGEHRLVVGTNAPRIEPLASPPVWITPLAGLPSEQRAIRDLKKELPPNEAIDLLFDEWVSSQKPEWRRLAARSHPYLGRYAALVTLLRSENEQWEDRRRHIDDLRTAIQFGPEEAKAVREILVREFGEGVGAAVYRLLCGYSAKELEGGQLAKLVDLLSHENLVLRATSFYHLERVAKTPEGRYVTYGYKPEETETRRRTPTQKWREKLRTNSILPRESPKAAAKGGPAKPDAEDDAPEPGIRLPASEAPAATPPPADPAAPADDPKPVGAP